MATGKARIKLIAKDPKKLNNVCEQIKKIAELTGVPVRGPVPLPTKRLRVAVRRSPCGDGSETWEHYEMRVHQRLIDISGDERTLRQIMRVKVPDEVYVHILLE
ncbi:30S ribosomal protein S10 [Candidatus Micrarchaeota archaeon]|nr:30S ribosomal protein S10 [Candidatus Micrarchaeota archaeon]